MSMLRDVVYVARLDHLPYCPLLFSFLPMALSWISHAVSTNVYAGGLTLTRRRLMLFPLRADVIIIMLHYVMPCSIIPCYTCCTMNLRYY